MTRIRPLEAGDEPRWRELWRGYLEFYEVESLPEAVTKATFDRLLNDDRLFAFVAEKDGDVIGFVHCVIHPVTWSLKSACYLEDLFVDRKTRGSGAGRALIEKVYDEAQKKDCDRVYWLTQEGNATARKLYDKVASLSGFVHYRVSV
ncbi:GNAT family N-acetyltransferase [Hyphococcus flavus]|uniref:GNAT family N-acetyltransferase n=1 Tax=Hyphococcus flavus TaxID=1866326 RepID=A0AAE9ZEZ8_9PROT|nr:GNAT family N-acetyltransferase [Hyphococcus flavus]WDI31623.1 GNAT family N-acetyltransferase [Hyphococcus flavus]